MARLTEAAIRAAKPKDKPYKLSDGRGLHLLVTPTGSRLWRFRFRVGRREKMTGLGAYPDVSLKMARERLDGERKLVAAEVNPAAKRRAERAATADTFEAIAAEWLGKQKYAPATEERTRWLLGSYLLPRLGSEPITALKRADVLKVLRLIEERGKHETAQRARRLVSQICRYSIHTGRAVVNPAADLAGALATASATNRAALIEPRELGALLRAIDGYVGQPATAFALRVLPYVFVRPGELRAGEWSEFDLDAGEWRIPAARTKMREMHLVPLANQVIDLLRHLEALTGRGRLLFPAVTHRDRPLSENTLNAALRRLGYAGDQHTAHGFRSTASTLLNEQGWHPDLIELQLAHRERNKVRAAYNRAQRLPERRKMMQAWADYLDGLKADTSNVVNLRTAKSA